MAESPEILRAVKAVRPLPDVVDRVLRIVRNPDYEIDATEPLVEHGRAAPVQFRQPQEIGRETAQRPQQSGDEIVLGCRLQQRVGRLLPADGAGALGTRRCRAERAGAVSRPHCHVIGQPRQPLQ